MAHRQLAIITGASSGIGLELAHECARQGFDLLVAADEPAIETAAAALRKDGSQVEAVQADLSTTAGVDTLLAVLDRRPVAALLANAGISLGHAFLDQDWADIRRVIDTNVLGTTYLLHGVLRGMRERGNGRVLITGSIVGFIPGPFQAVYNGSKAFLDNFSAGIRNELHDSGVTVTRLMPGATETAVFERAGMADTPVGTAPKDDPAMVARAGFEAMMRGDAEVIPGWHNKLQVALAHVTPAPLLAEVHRHIAKPAEGEPAR